jgi:transformer-2 protein
MTSHLFSWQVLECRLVLDPRTRESRGFGFVTMDHLDDAERCIKHLNRSTLEGRMITVEKVRICGVSGFRILRF